MRKEKMKALHEYEMRREQFLQAKRVQAERERSAQQWFAACERLRVAQSSLAEAQERGWDSHIAHYKNEVNLAMDAIDDLMVHNE
jgi:hypothetical protein